MSSRVIVVTGTDTGVGKTMVTAALAARLRGRGNRVHIRKPVQTGCIDADDPRRPALESAYSDVVTRSDAQIAGHLAGVEYSTGVCLTLPMTPTAAASASGAELPSPREHAEAILGLLTPAPDDEDAAGDAIILVEGAGGLLVDFGHGATIADIAATTLTVDPGVEVEVIVVARPGLGTLNHTALTCQALHRRGLPVSGIVLGTWPRHPSPVDLDNRRRLGESGPLIGALPDHCGTLSPTDFRAGAAGWTTIR